MRAEFQYISVEERDLKSDWIMIPLTLSVDWFLGRFIVVIEQGWNFGVWDLVVKSLSFGAYP